MRQLARPSSEWRGSVAPTGYPDGCRGHSIRGEMPGSQSIRRWSTQDIPKSARFDHWLNLVCTSTWPVTDWSGISDDFSVELEEAPLGCLSSLKETMVGAPHARRT